MFYIVETESSLKKLEIFKYVPCYMEIILANDYYHPALSTPTAVYLRPKTYNHGFIIPIDHSEGFSMSLDEVKNMLSSFDFLYVKDRKKTLYHFISSNILDIRMAYLLEFGIDFNMDCNISIIQKMYNRHMKDPNINKCIPISKLFEKCEMEYEKISSYLSKVDVSKISGWDFHNNTLTNVFFIIESSPMTIKREEFIEVNSIQNPEFNIQGNKVYTRYNLYNKVGRPTNSFNKVNFCAIPKNRLHRECIIPNNENFIEFDFKAYHVRLIAKLIGYDLPSDKIHQYFGKIYFGKDIEKDSDLYDKSKKITFQSLYGTPPKEAENVEFFKKMAKKVDYYWGKFKLEGYVEVPISGKRFLPSLENIDKKKLFNYILQNYETANNVLVLKELLNILKNKSTKAKLYNYDAILLDFSTEEGAKLAREVKSALESQGFPVDFKMSDSYFI